MGTNYYLAQEPCPHCGRGGDDLHIGKSSAGWVFALHVHPDQNINDLPDWWDRWTKPLAAIRDEYGKPLTAQEMLAVVLARFGPRDKTSDTDSGFYIQNHAVPGPYGLARSRIGGSCIAHGSGTYDLHTGDFS